MTCELLFLPLRTIYMCEKRQNKRIHKVERKANKLCQNLKVKVLWKHYFHIQDVAEKSMKSYLMQFCNSKFAAFTVCELLKEN